MSAALGLKTLMLSVKKAGPSGKVTQGLARPLSRAHATYKTETVVSNSRANLE